MVKERKDLSQSAEPGKIMHTVWPGLKNYPCLQAASPQPQQHVGRCRPQEEAEKGHRRQRQAQGSWGQDAARSPQLQRQDDQERPGWAAENPIAGRAHAGATLRGHRASGVEPLEWGSQPWEAGEKEGLCPKALSRQGFIA